jgi:SAM-dependent methyltransferase
VVDREAAFYEAHQDWCPEAAGAIAAHLRASAPGARAAVFLGCASGVNDALPFARRAPDVRVLASDVEPGYLRALAARAEGMSNLRIRKIDVTADLGALEPADLVAIFFVVHRLPSWEDIVPPLARLVAPGGRLFTSEFAGPDGVIYRSNEHGGRADDPVSRLIRRAFELRSEPFAPPLRSTRMGPFLDALGRGLVPAGHRDVAWPQSLTVGEMYRKIETGAHAPFVLRPPPAVLERLRDEFRGEWSERVDLTETIRVHQFRRAQAGYT